MQKLVFCLLVFGTVQTVLAAGIKCPEASGIARTECLEKGLHSAEAELTQVFGKSIASINSKDNDHVPKSERGKWKSAAEKAQHNWQAYRDTECQTITPYLWWGGSGTSGAVVECSLVKTQARIKELREIYGIK